MRFFNYLKFISINKKVIFYHKKNCKKLWQNQEKTAAYADNCRQNGFFTAEEYIDTMFRHCGK